MLDARSKVSPAALSDEGMSVGPGRRVFLGAGMACVASLAGCVPWRSWGPRATRTGLSWHDALSAFLPRARVAASVSGPNWALGHRVGTQLAGEPDEELFTRVAIIGGGVAGLCAGAELLRNGVDSFVLCELEERTGGNATSYTHAVSAAPLGAHYVTFANPEATDLKQLYRELGIITAGEHTDTPTYNPDYCCFDLSGRVHSAHGWDKGLLPSSLLTQADRVEIARFEDWVEELRMRKGSDGRPWFALPMRLSSTDAAARTFDAMAFSTVLDEAGFRSEALRWSIRYACRDDFGTEPEDLSAWVGLHYFASRRGRAQGLSNTPVLTWPEGNAWITDRLRQRLGSRVKTSMAVLHAEETAAEVVLTVFDALRGKSVRVRAERVIVAVPSHVAAKLFPDAAGGVAPFAWTKDDYTPWLVANVHVDARALDGNVSAAWDNVPYQGRSLGYIVATHQSLVARRDSTLVTYYEPFSQEPVASARAHLAALDASALRDRVVAELETMHPGITTAVHSVDAWIWPHAMPRPGPGALTRLWAAGERRSGRVSFAHSDLSGLSLFEEAHDWGTRQARACAQDLG
jgi:protoporphyrinogen oxidase